MTCKCRAEVNEYLAERNAVIFQEWAAFGRLGKPMKSGWTPPRIVVHRLDKSKRGRLPKLEAKFCPFCGKRFRDGMDMAP